MRDEDFDAAGGDVSATGQNEAGGPTGGASRTKSLLPHHRDHLHASGMTDETIGRRGYWSCDDPTGRALLHWPTEMQGDASGLVIPYPNVPGYVKIRTDHPRLRTRTRERAKVNAGSDHNYAAVGDANEYVGEVIKYEA